MIPLTLFPDQDVFVLGLGRTGLSVSKALILGGAKVHVWDDMEERRDTALSEGFRVSPPESVDWSKIKTLIVSPGIPHNLPKPHPVVEMALEHGVPLENDISLFGELVSKLPMSRRPKVIGVTGTNGKSTTTSLIGHILKSENKTVHIGGNIGVPVFDLPIPTRDTFYVLELSSYQLELVKDLCCDVSILLNLSPDHLDRHGDMEGYIKAKARIFQNQTPRQTSVIGFDGVVMQAFAMTPSLRGQGKFVPISTKYVSSNGVCVIDGKIHANMAGRAEVLGNINEAYALKGEHNGQNAAAAFAACSALDIRSERIVQAMNSFAGLPHRLEFVSEHLGVTYVNDSKATNPEAAISALHAFPNSHWIAGGEAKQGNLDAIKMGLSKTRKAYLFGACAQYFADAFSGLTSIEVFDTLPEAFWAAQNAVEAEGGHQTVLFSPAAASFDQFSDFVERGNAFKSLVGTVTMAERA